MQHADCDESVSRLAVTCSLHRTDRVEILRTFQFDDSADDVFEREPFSVLVRSKEEGRGG